MQAACRSHPAGIKPAAHAEHERWLPSTPPALQGVGSHAAHLLLRSGVGRLRLIDFDQASAAGF